MVTFDASIALGTMIHLAVLLVMVGWLSWKLLRWLRKIEAKQDKLMDILTAEATKKGRKGDRA